MPTLYLGVLGKPWRGDITAMTEKDINNSFEQYNKFILHYANLKLGESKHAKDLLSGFTIGT